MVSLVVVVVAAAAVAPGGSAVGAGWIRIGTARREESAARWAPIVENHEAVLAIDSAVEARQRLVQVPALLVVVAAAAAAFLLQVRMLLVAPSKKYASSCTVLSFPGVLNYYYLAK